jgi:hypothetical protein
MVQIEKYGEWLLQELGFGGDLVRVLYEALEYGIPPQDVAMLRCWVAASVHECSKVTTPYRSHYERPRSSHATKRPYHNHHVLEASESKQATSILLL